MLHSQCSRQDFVSKKSKHRASLSRFSVRNVAEFVDKEGGVIAGNSLEEGQDSRHLVCILGPSRENQFPPHPYSEKRNSLLDVGRVAIKVDEILVVLFGVLGRRFGPLLAMQLNMHGDSSSRLERLAAILARNSAGS